MRQIPESHYLEVASAVQFVLGAVMSVVSITVFAVNWRKLSRWEKSGNVAVGVIGIALALMAPMQARWQSRVEDDKATQTRLEADRQRTQMEQSLNRAQGEARRAKEDAASARDAQVRLQNELNSAEKELSDVQAKTAPRALLQAQHRT